MYISKDFLYFVLFCLASTLAVFLIIASIKLMALINRITGIIDANRPNIDKTIKILPETAENINNVAISIKENVDKLGTTITGLENTVSSVTATEEDTGGIISFINVIMSVVKAVKNVIAIFSKD